MERIKGLDNSIFVSYFLLSLQVITNIYQELIMRRLLLPLFSVLILCIMLMPAAAITQGLSEGTKTPDFTLKDLQGGEISLSDFHGKVLILHFWKAN